MTDLTPEKIEALREMEKAATPGVWKLAGASHVYTPGEHGANICSISEPRATKQVRYTELELGSRDWKEACANANLIVAARNALPALLSAASDLDEALRLLRKYAPDDGGEVSAFLSRHSGGAA